MTQPSIAQSRIDSADGPDALSSYHAYIHSRDGVMSIHSSRYEDYDAVSINCGPVTVSLDTAAARALGEQLIAATDHYDQQRAGRTQVA